MGIEVTRVGRRWFHCISGELKISVEATSSTRTRFEVDHEKSKEAGYQVWVHIPYTDWTLTGKGANKYREEVIAALEEKIANE